MKKECTVGILSLGCPRNLVDAENMLGELVDKGYSVVDIDKADIAIVNTCAFIEEAKKESIDAVLDVIELKKEGKVKKIIVAGCLTQRYQDDLKQHLPEVDAFIGVPALTQSRKRFAITPKHYAYLKICEGCIHNCSYCVIPRIKGAFASIAVPEVVKKAIEFDRGGVSELNIIGQDISGYGIDLYGSRKLPYLLKQIIKKTRHIPWIRLLYLYPDNIVKDVLAVMNESRRFCRYIDLPAQHINNRILKLMNRRSSKKQILSLLETVRKKAPDVAVRTSLIVGFPSETDEEFKELLDFVKEARFERLGVFMFSREEQTPAYEYKDQISHKVKSERFNAVMSLQQKISKELNRNLLGKTITVLIDEKDKDMYLGRTQYDAPEVDGMVYIKERRTHTPGSFIKVKITDTLEYDLVGEEVV